VNVADESKRGDRMNLRLLILLALSFVRQCPLGERNTEPLYMTKRLVRHVVGKQQKVAE
jgi:hypothetical protein